MPLTLTIRAGDARRLLLPVLPNTDPTPTIPCLGRVHTDATGVPA